MRNSKLIYIAFMLIFSCGNLAVGQEIDKNLLVGKWKFAKTTSGPAERDYQYNGDPLLTFETNGRWITEDSNPNYRQSGTWKVENNNLVRDPDKTPTRDVPPYERKIEKLTANELVISASQEGFRRFTFYFTKIE